MTDEGFQLNMTQWLALVVSALGFAFSLSLSFMLIFDNIVTALAVSLPSAFSMGVAFYYAFKQDAARDASER